MAVTAPPPYPKALTDADWQKKKGIIAKFAGETGIGAQLKKIKKMFDDNVDWGKFYAKTLCTKEKGVLTPGAAIKLQEAMKSEMKGPVNLVREELKKLETLCDTILKTKFDAKKNKLIPESAREAVRSVSTEADHFNIALKTNGVYATESDKEFKEEIARLERLQDKAKVGIKDCMTNLASDGEAVKKTPTVVLFTGSATKGFYQRIRGANAALMQLEDYPELNKFRSEIWIKFSQSSFVPKKDEEVLAKVETVLKAAAVLNKLIEKNLA